VKHRNLTNPGLESLSLFYFLYIISIIIQFNLVITGIDNKWSLGTLGTPPFTCLKQDVQNIFQTCNERPFIYQIDFQ
jgi:hypothetical protein